MVRSVAGDLPEQIKNNQSVNMAAGNGGQKNEPVLMVYRVRITEDFPEMRNPL